MENIQLKDFIIITSGGFGAVNRSCVNNWLFLV